MNNVDTMPQNRPMSDRRTPQLKRKYGNITFEVVLHFSTTSKETFNDKVMRLIRNDILSKEML